MTNIKSVKANENKMKNNLEMCDQLKPIEALKYYKNAELDCIKEVFESMLCEEPEMKLANHK